MSFNSYNTRNSGRYNTPGRLVSSGELAPGGPVGYGRGNRGHNNGMNNQYRQNQRQYQQQQQPQPSPQQQQPPEQPPEPPQVASLSQPMEDQNQTLQNMDVEMKIENMEPVKESVEGIGKPYWMKSKLTGVKKISNKERRRRQNENLRRLLAPKNALMVLNEMMPGERECAQFKVEPAPPHPYYNAPNAHSFCAELTVEGVTYKGYGDNKIAARNDAAEQAIRDLIIKRMAKVHNVEASTPVAGDGEGGQQAGGAGGGEEEAALPMIQLASFALHKLFAEWECDGHKVPQLRALAPQISDTGSEASTAGGGGGGASAAGGGTRGKPQRSLPANAATMHPCMLLTYMRPHLEYRELAVDGDRPQNMVFTMGIDVDGVTYIGKATNKREARKQAARAACYAIFGVTFTEGSVATPAAMQMPVAAAHKPEDA